MLVADAIPSEPCPVQFGVQCVLPRTVARTHNPGCWESGCGAI
jgi:hypothetical protein